MKSLVRHKSKPTVLIFTAFYLPGYLGGGPIRSVSNLVNALSDEFQFLIFTCDRDLGGKSPYEGIKVNDWNTIGQAEVFYADSSIRTLAGIARFLSEIDFDLLYLNSFFDFDFTIKPLIIRMLNPSKRNPILLAPRGEFSAGALNVKSLRKSLFFEFAKLTGLYSKVSFHASNEYEKNDIKKILPKFQKLSSIKASDILCAPPISMPLGLDFSNIKNNVDLFELGKRGGSDKLKVCFLSRISPKKNLDFALNVLSQVSIPVEFTIYGPHEDLDYWRVCRDIIANLPINVNVNVAGAVPGNQIVASLCKHDLFFLPTHGENFGHVFLEAWASGLPVLVSDHTPWRCLSRLKVGWDIPLDRKSEYINVLEEVGGYSHEQWTQIRKLCVRMASEHACNRGTLAANRQLFSSLLPESVVVKVETLPEAIRHEFSA